MSAVRTLDFILCLRYPQTKFEPWQGESTTVVPLPLGGGKTKDVGTGHTRPVDRADGFYGAILPTERLVSQDDDLD